MTTKKISELSAAAALDGTEQVPVVQAGATLRSTVAAFLVGVVKLVGNQTIAGTKTFSDPPVVPTATLGTHAINKAQAEGLVTSGATVSGTRPPVKVVSLTNQNVGLLSLPGPMDGYQPVDGDRVLLVGQTAPAENGIWTVGALLGWQRPADFATASNQAGAGVNVAGGTVYKGSAWVLNSTGTVTVGGSAQTWIQDATAVRTAALALKADDSAVVHDFGNENVGGIKTFLDSPVVPDGSWPVAATFGLQAALDAKAADSAVVKLTGDQTIAGNKTFAAAPQVPDASFTIAKTSGLQAALDAAVALGTFYVGDATGVAATDIANVEAAIDDAIAAPRGGIVQFGPGVYNLNGIDPILLPEAGATGKQVTLRGAGGGNGTIITASTDGAAGEYLIAGSGLSSAANGSYKTVVEDLTFYGPDAFDAYATTRTPCNLSGIMLDTHVQVNRCTFTGFRYGFCAAGNHSTVRDSTFTNGYVGARWTATAGAGGDVLLDNVNVAGNTFASHAIAPTGVAAFHSVRGHVGFAPYGIYFEPGGGAGTIRLYYCVFDATSFEFMGNAMLYDPDQAAGVEEVHWRNCGNFSSNNATYGLQASTYHNQVFVHTFRNSSFEGGSPNYACTESHFNVSGILSGVSMDRCLVGMAQAVTDGVPFVKGIALQNQSTVVLRDANFQAVAVPCHSAGAVTAKTLVERTQFGYARPFAYAGAGTRLPLAGVARNAGVASGREYVIVVQESPDQEILMTGGVDPTGNQVLVPSTATPTSVEPLSWDGTTATLTKPIVGQLYLAVAGSASVRARVRVL